LTIDSQNEKKVLNMTEITKKIYLEASSTTSEYLFECIFNLGEYLTEEDYLNKKWTVTPILIQTEKSLPKQEFYSLFCDRYVDASSDEIPVAYLLLKQGKKVHFVSSTNNSDKSDLYCATFEIKDKKEIIKFYLHSALEGEEETDDKLGNYILHILLEITKLE